MSEAEALRKIHKMDKLRAAYYNEYVDASWGKADNYNVCMNLSKISVSDIILINL